MTKTVEEVRRAAFEAWALDKWPSVPLHRRDALPVGHERYGQYVHLEHEWQAFNAGLDAVEIQLPRLRAYPPNEASSDVDYWIDEAKWETLSKCRAAIEQTGLGLRVK